MLNANYTGCLKMLSRSKEWLSLFPNDCMGIDVRDLRDNALIVEKFVMSLSPDTIYHIDQSMFKPIKFSNQEE
jgi:hypothetical protein